MDLHAKQLREEFWHNDALKGSPIGKPYKEIEFLTESSEEAGRDIRNKKLQDMLNYAVVHCPYYQSFRERCQLKLSSFPVMNKLKYIENYNDIKVEESIIPGQVGPVHIQSTSGSTGTPFKVPQDTLKRQRRVAELKYFGKIVGFDTHEMLIHLRTWNKWQNKTAAQIKSENIIPFDISEMGESKLQELCQMIVDNQALCLRGYASSFDLLAKYVKDHPMTFPSLKICIAGSEALQDDVRANVKETLGCEIISQYANEECGILAQERVPTSDTDNVMYLNHASYFFELLKLDCDEPAGYGELGRIVITDLHNHAFPIIRYDNGDVGILGEPDEYSHGYPVLKKLYGRRFDVCYTVDNEPFFPMTIGRTLKHFDQIAQWQFIQKGQKEYLLKMVMRNSESAKDYLAPVIPELKATLGESAVINIEQVNEIPVLASGKRKSVVNEWKKCNTIMNKEIYALGVGHNTPVFIDLAMDCGYEIAGLYHYNSDRTGETDHGFPILGSFDDLFSLGSLAGKSFLLTMGDSRIRMDLAKKFIELGGTVPTLIHPSAVISKFAKISDTGVYISAFTYVQADSTVGDNTVLLSHVNISHTTHIGSGCFIAGASVVGAYTNVEDHVFIGQGALSISGKVPTIGEGAYIGARSLLTKSVPAHAVVAGSPAKVIKTLL